MSGGITDRWFEARGADEKDPDIPGFWTWEADYVYGGSFSGKSVGCQGVGKGSVSDGVIGRAGKGVHGVVALAKGADDRYDPSTAPPSGLLALSEGLVTAIYARSYKSDGVGPLPAITAISSGIGISANGDPAIQAQGIKQGAAISATEGTGAAIVGNNLGAAILARDGIGADISGSVGIDVNATDCGLRVTSRNDGMKVGGGTGIGVSGDSSESYGGRFASGKTSQLLLQPTPDTSPDNIDFADAGSFYVRLGRNPDTNEDQAELFFCTVSGGPGVAKWTRIA